MDSESPQDRRMRELWQNQQTEGFRMSVEQVRASAGKFQQKIRWRNAREYVAALAIVIFFGFQFLRTDDVLLRAGFGLAVAGALYVAWKLHSNGSARPIPKDAGLASCIEFQRRELERQRDLLKSIWRWYLGPLIPGLAVLIVAMGRSNPGNLQRPGVFTTVYTIFAAAIFLGVAKLNSRGAQRIQKRIDELNARELDEHGRPR